MKTLTLWVLAMLAMLWVSAVEAGDAAAGAGGRITMLYDAFGKPSDMQKDWGFSALVEYGGKRILVDTGNDPRVFAHNVAARGVDLGRLDFVVLTHRHGDHTSGLGEVLKVNPQVKIYAPKENFGVFGAALPGTFIKPNTALPPELRYFDGQVPDRLRFGTPWDGANFEWVTQSSEIAPGIHLILLKGSWGVDLDVMEISLVLDTPDGTVVVVGCSHPTIEKIVEAAQAQTGKPIHLVLGGTHLLPASEAEIGRIALALRDERKVDYIAPVHCTGEAAFGILRQVFAARYVYAGLGTTVLLGPTITTGDAGGPTMSRAPQLDAGERAVYRRLAAQESHAAAPLLVRRD